MAVLKTKTYLNCNPNGLIKVLYCAAKDDFEEYFNEISDLIIKYRHNVAIYYAEPDEIPAREQIAEMKLVVAPVTAGFLDKDNVARTKIFAVAKELRIPLLPILEEQGIERTFNLVVGNIQCLNAQSTDSSEIAFESKLKTFLDTVIVDDEEIDSIKKAFKNCAFISYRKKDREYANDLMRQIHGIDELRDLAIWYDEYLIPGEDFNDSIKAAVDDSDAVILVVTPNLINESNYVQSVEYPYARSSAQKDIVPVETVTTDATKVRMDYPGVEEIIDVNDRVRLEEELKRIFPECVTSNDQSPVHLYYIGMAYLYGIRVESDIDRAVSLLKESMEGGCNEAGEKLSNLYIEGQYVEHDYYEAVRILTIISKRYFENLGALTEDQLRKLIELRTRIVNILSTVGLYNQAYEIQKLTLELLDILKSESSSEENVFIRINGIKLYCEILSKMEGHKEEAMENLIEVFNAYLEKFKESGYDTRWDLLRLAKLASDLDEDDWFDRLWRFVKDYAMSAQSKGRDSFCDYSYSYTNFLLDYCAYITGLLENGVSVDQKTKQLLYEKEREIKQGCILLSQMRPEVNLPQLISRYQRIYGNLYYADGRKENAQQMYKMAFLILFNKFEIPDNIIEEIENIKKVLMICKEIEDNELKEAAESALSYLNLDMYEATGLDEYNN